MKLVVYVLCFDDASEARARADFAGLGWARVTRLRGDSKYMEGQAFLTALEARKEEWRDADFVGTLSWRARDKMRADLVGDVVDSVGPDAEAVAFLPLPTDSLLAHAAACHPRFLEAWVPLLLELGASVQDAVSSHIPSFFCNYWVARPRHMEQFLDFFARAVRVLDTLPCIQDALWSDSGYRSESLGPDRLREIYGTPHMPLHPFLAERLACYFFWKHPTVLVMAPLGTRGMWEQVYRAERERTDAKEQLSKQLMQWLEPAA